MWTVDISRRCMLREHDQEQNPSAQSSTPNKATILSPFEEVIYIKEAFQEDIDLLA
jgi:hypothetical protein